MSLRSNALLLLVLLALGSLPGAARAAESYDSCGQYVYKMPYVISAPGHYCLSQNWETSITTGNAITVKANDVILDCNGYTLNGLGAGVATKAHGIGGVGRLNVTVRHCNIRGFYEGIVLNGTGSGNHTIEDNRLDSNTYTAAWVEGDGSVLRRNLVLDTGGSTAIAIAQGIRTRGVADVLDNTVAGVVGAGSGVGSAYGIYTGSNAGGSVEGNRVRGVVAGGTGLARGIYNYQSGRVSLVGNDVIGNAAAGSIGLRCANALARARDNVVAGYETPLDGCGNAGGNDL